MALIIYLAASCILVYTDIKYRRLSDVVICIIAILGIVIAAINGNTVICIASALATLAVTIAMTIKRLIGGGDAKLAAGLSAWHLYPDMLLVVGLGCALGAIWGMVLMHREGKLWDRVKGLLKGRVNIDRIPENGISMNSIPLGACLVIASWITMIGR